MSNKVKTAAAPAKGISTEKPATPAAIPEVAKHIPSVPKVNAGNIEYTDDKVNEVIATIAKMAVEAEVKVKKTKVRNPDRNIARNIVAKLFPHIKILIDKGYTKKEMYEIFTAQGIAINFAGFSSATNKQLKAQAEAEKKIVLELDAAENEAGATLKGEGDNPTQEELDAEERLAADHVA